EGEFLALAKSGGFKVELANHAKCPKCIEHVGGDVFQEVPQETSSSVKVSTQIDAITMTQNPGGKERTEGEFLALAKSGGFKVELANHAKCPKMYCKLSNFSKVEKRLSYMVRRYRRIYSLLNDELQNGLHALSIEVKTPAEIVFRGAYVQACIWKDVFVKVLSSNPNVETHDANARKLILGTTS
nr:caffeic acid 3-O-methyltransferase-like [Tanacetum cinerariifolium]